MTSAADYLAKLKWAETSFEGFVKFLYPHRTFAPFQLDFIRTLDKLERRELYHPNTGEKVYNLLTNFPPRHAKSHYGTVLFPAYLMGRNPSRKTMVGAYNSDLAVGFGKDTKAIVESPAFHQVFPKFRMSRDTRSGDEWKTDSRGAYYAIGFEGTTSGRPANALIIDDPIKNRTEAESAATRRTVWDNITSSFWSRMEPEEDGTPPIQIMTLTRWHPDDPAGRLQKLPEWEEGEWLHVYYQGLTELPPETTDPDARTDPKSGKIYKALWPERFDVPYLLRQKSRSERDFASLYQQQPIIEGGNMVKSSWWRYLPADFDPNRFNYHSILIAADTAFKERSRNDYSAIAVGGITAQGDIHLIDMRRARLPFPDLKRLLIQMNAYWRSKGLRAIIVEDHASGQSIIQELRAESGLAIIPRRWPGDKVSHLSAILPLIEGGRIFLPHPNPTPTAENPTPKKPDWLPDFLSEVEQFPTGTFDDQVDAVTLLIHELSRTAITPDMMAVSFDAFQSLNKDAKTITGLYGKSLAQQLADSFGGLDNRGNKPWGE